MRRYEIQSKLYKATLIMGALLSVISIIGNYIAEFSFSLDIKWLVLFAIAVVAYIFFDNSKYSDAIMFGLFVFLVFVFLPFSYIDSGGNSNNAIGYIFLLLIIITFLFSGFKRMFLIIALIAVFIVMQLIEYNFPQVISVYGPEKQFVDRLIQIPFLLLASFIIIQRFSKEYESVNNKLGNLARFDELTGLYNRRIFNKAIEKAFKSNKKTIFLAFLDLNNFKKVNDKFGHYTGDKALKKLSEILKSNFEFNKHLICRWGGDEFAIIYNGDEKELKVKLNNVNIAFNNYISKYEETAGISISIVPFSDYDTISQILNVADMQLYKQKHNNQMQK